MSKYKHLFFDLDHTLWDFEHNSKKALTSVFYECDLRRMNVQSPDHFIETYLPINYQMWSAYRRGEIDAQEVKHLRFQNTLKKFGLVSQSMVKDVGDAYLAHLPRGGNLMPNVLHILKKLHAHYRLHVVTNGFQAITKVKLQNSGITDFFQLVLSAEEVGVLKPDKRVFQTAVNKTKAKVEESLFIGDSIIADIEGASSFGMDQVFYNPKNKQHQAEPTYEITDMAELESILISG